jgi:hypothetical protein
MRMPTKLAVVAIAVGSLLAASCGSSSKPAAKTDTTKAAAAGGDGVAKAKAAVVNFEKEPAGIGITKPLSKKAPKKKIAWLECDVPTCTASITPGFKDAAAAIGWDLMVIPVKSGDPSAGFQQALDGGADYIAITGSPYATFKAGAEAAKAKGVPVLECYNTDQPSVETNLLMQCGSTAGVQSNNKLLADYIIADSNGAANVLYATINDFPVLKSSSDAFKAELGATCPTCTFTELNVTLDDLLGGKIPGAIASQLQANKKLNYLMYSFGGMSGGITPALKTAGLDTQVKQIGQDFSDFDLPEIVAGTMKAWSANPKGYSAWLMVHAAALHATGMPPADVIKEMAGPSILPTFLVTDPKVATSIIATKGDWNPAGMDAAFKKLWLV